MVRFTFNRMNLRRLITFVSERPCIWDQTHANYNNQVLLRQTWSEIAEELGCSVDVCRQKWRNLRDVFRRELRKYQARLENPNIVDKTQPRWHFFKELQFLTNQILGPDNNIPDLLAESQGEQFESYYVVNSGRSTIKNEPDSDDDEEDEVGDNHHEDHNECSRKVTSAPDRITLRRSVGHSFEDGRRRRRPPKREREKEDDSDYFFMMSLLPFMTSIPSKKKLAVRNKIQDILYEELETPSDPC